MPITKKFFLAIGGVLAIAVLATGLWWVNSPTQVSFAQAPIPTTPAYPAPADQAGTQSNWQAYQETFLNAFASKLGVTLDKLKEAYSAAFNETVDQAVTDGKLTADQATQMKDRNATELEQGRLPGFGVPFGHGGFGEGRGHGRGGRMGGHGVFEMDVIAQTLNMTEADLMSALQGGKTLADLAQEKSVELATVKDAVLANLKTQLDQAVTDGKLTQAQADQMYTQAGTEFDTKATQAWTGRGGPGEPGMGPQGQNGQGQTTPDQNNP